MNKKHSILLAAAVCLFTGSALADDQKTYPGSVCVKQGTAGGFAHYFGTVYNSSTTTDLTVMCPFVRDNTDSDQNLAGANLHYFDNNSSKNISCTIFNEVAFGTSFTIWSSTKVPVPNGNHAQWITFGSLGTNGSNESAFEHLYATCIIPPLTSQGGTHVAAWHVQEDTN